MDFLQNIKIFDIMIISYMVVHIHLQYRVWIKKEKNIFKKYAVEKNNLPKELEISKWVYFTKATWMILFVVLQYFGMSFKTAYTYSFFVYAIELQLLFPFNLYNMLNLILSCAGLFELLFLL
eukprot:TRINITY_DN5215_c0_g1_i1.p1 TRINITY_DN5215_c0_g1~~TRINITY_DN5215_c0_g1_i1.p1  ORF type:complete len:122 (-),score=6.95 TRINITY_DN5215_c0_g1_i1:25-390(-)